MAPQYIDMEEVADLLRETCDNCTEDNICRECYLAREGEQ